MTMRLAVARANVTGPEGSGESWENVMAETRGGHLTLRTGKTILLDVEAQAVQPQPGRKWLVTTTAGVYLVARAGGCGCGRG